jgi:flavin-binding protein dodecin
LLRPLKAERVPRPKRFGPGPDVKVHDGPTGPLGVTESEDFHYEPIPLTDEDTWEYPISLPHFVDGIRSDNGINGSGFDNDNGLIPLGTKAVGPSDPAWVYLSLPNGNEQAVLARCARLRVPNAQQKTFLLLPQGIAFSSEARRILRDSNVRALSLWEPAATGSLAVDWAATCTSIPAVEGASIFRKENDLVWALSFAGQTVHLQDRTGMSYIAELLRRPRAPIEALRLTGALAVETQLVDRGIPASDEESIGQAKAMLQERESDIARLPANDWVRRNALQEEIDNLKKYLAQVQDQHGRPRLVGGSAERSRTAVTNAVNRAREYISEHHLALGQHLKGAIQTGTLLIYRPSEVPDWQF